MRQVYTGRFAPSPTGPLHLGSLFTAVIGFCRARSLGGQWQLRIDDLDGPRTVPGSADLIQATLEAFGLEWDGTVSYQSHRLESYRSAIAELQRQGLLYRCACSRKDVASSHPPGKGGIYAGRCRRNPPRDLKVPCALRIIADQAVITFEDGLQGAQQQNLARTVGDFVVLRRDNVPAYHLATVVDDAELGITEVLRGFDLLESSPRQIFIRQQLNLPKTLHAHSPVLTDMRGQKLSKQSHSPGVPTESPGQVLIYLLRLMGQNPELELAQEPVSVILQWAVSHFNFNALGNKHTIPVEPYFGHHEKAGPIICADPKRIS